MIKIIDNFLDKQDLNKFKVDILSNHSKFTWLYCNLKVKPDFLDKNYFNYQFYHPFKIKYNEDYFISERFDILNPILRKLNVKHLYRAKLNLSPYMGDKIIEYDMHLDITEECTIGIYYLNTNNGYTLLENGCKVKSIENRMLLIPSNMLHTGTTCTDKKYRIVLNLNFTT